MSASPEPGDDLAVRANQLDVQRHLSDRVGRAAQARVERPHAGLHAVEYPLGYLRAVDVLLRDLLDRPVHRQVVLPGGDQQVNLPQLAVLVHLVVVEERAARRLATADAFKPVDAAGGPQPVGVQEAADETAFFATPAVLQDRDALRIASPRQGGIAVWV